MGKMMASIGGDAEVKITEEVLSWLFLADAISACTALFDQHRALYASDPVEIWFLMLDSFKIQRDYLKKGLRIIDDCILNVYDHKETIQNIEDYRNRLIKGHEVIQGSMDNVDNLISMIDGYLNKRNEKSGKNHLKIVHPSGAKESIEELER